MAETLYQPSNVVFTLGNVATRSDYNIRKWDHVARITHSVRKSQDLYSPNPRGPCHNNSFKRNRRLITPAHSALPIYR